MANEYGIDTMTGPAGSATVFDSNCMHGSNGNITPFARSNLFIVFNSVENTLTDPFSAPAPRPDYLGSRDFTPCGNEHHDVPRPRSLTSERGRGLSMPRNP